MSAAGDNLALRGVSRMAISQGEDEAKYIQVSQLVQEGNWGLTPRPAPSAASFLLVGQTTRLLSHSVPNLFRSQ
jgi:hypothetical protein